MKRKKTFRFVARVGSWSGRWYVWDTRLNQMATGYLKNEAEANREALALERRR